MLYLTNTLTKNKEQFHPIKPDTVGMYNCGPTVYNYAHIGNLRSYVFADILRRALELNNLTVTQVINITDIGHLSSDSDDGEDKMTKALKREGKPLTLEAMKEIATFYTEKFRDDLKALNITLPEHMPKASENIPEDLQLISQLYDKGFIYKTSDGLYYDTAKNPQYGKLGGISDNNAEARVETNPEKHSPRDFAVWKFNSELGYESPFGKGFPGWHIECSAMSMKYLGETFDIHTGGIDHIPVHHNNEIAQSESATGKDYSKFWLHNAFVTVPSGKMAKSEGNVFYLKDVIEHKISPLAYRYWLLTAHYSKPITFSWDAVAGAEQAYSRLVNFIRETDSHSAEINPEYQKQFEDFINDDLDTPKAIALIWQLLGDNTITSTQKKVTILSFDTVLGLGLATLAPVKIPEAVATLLAKREEARKEKNWEESDRLRQEIRNNGFEIKDTDAGTQLYPIAQ